MPKRNLLIFLIILLLVLPGVYFMSQQLLTPKPVPPIVNPGFEEGLTGWQSAGKIESDGHNSPSRLTHETGKLETTQTLKDIPDGWYTLRAWVRSSGGQKEASIGLKDCGGPEQRTAAPLVRAEGWLRIVVSAQVTGGQCALSLSSEADGDEWVSFDDVEFVAGRASLSIMGADISSLKKSEDKGGVYLSEDGKPEDALKILHDHGLNYARIRVWVDSPDGYHGKAQLLEMARRYKQQGIKLLVDFHYADSWADPGKQPKPKAWEKLDFEALKKALYDHTFDVCNALKAQGTPPDMVQVGNEITNGMLWPDGKNDQNFDNLAALLKEGYRAVKDCSAATLVMLHVDNGGKNELFRWWFDEIISHEVPFDVIGASYYSYWHGSLADLQNNLDDIALRYNKDIIVVETAYPFTTKENDTEPNVIRSQSVIGYRLTPEGQARMLADVMSVVRAVPDGRGLGIFWWDATWTAVPGNGWDPAQPKSGNGWENQALFDFNNRPLPAMGLFGKP